jgi:hypothetical protein
MIVVRPCPYPGGLIVAPGIALRLDVLHARKTRVRSVLALALLPALLLVAPAAVLAGHAPQEIVSAAASNATQVGLADTPTVVIKKSITVPWQSRIVGRAALDVYESGVTATTVGLCDLTTDGTASSASDVFNLRFNGHDANVLVTGARVEPAGTHTVRAVCHRVSGQGLIFNRGDLTVLAIRIRSSPLQVTSAATRNSPDSVVSPGGTTELQKTVTAPWSALLLADASLGLYTQDTTNEYSTGVCSLRESTAPIGVGANTWVNVYGLDPITALGAGSSLSSGTHTVDARCSSSGPGALKYRAGDLVLVAVRKGTSPTEVRAASVTTSDDYIMSSAGTVVMTRSITLPWKARIVAGATVKLYESASQIVWNASCQIQLELANQPIGQLQFVELVYNAVYKQHEENVPLAGAAVRAAGTYTVQVMCFAPSRPGDNAGVVIFDRGVLNLIAVRI